MGSDVRDRLLLIYDPRLPDLEPLRQLARV